MQAIQKAHAYATRNGCTLSLRQYARSLYAGHLSICARCGITPALSLSEYIKSQE